MVWLAPEVVAQVGSLPGVQASLMPRFGVFVLAHEIQQSS
jgi:hypothetical protein